MSLVSLLNCYVCVCGTTQVAQLSKKEPDRVTGIIRAGEATWVTGIIRAGEATWVTGIIRAGEAEF